MKADKLVWAGRVMTALTAPLFLLGVYMIFTGDPQVTAGMAKYGWPPETVKTIGWLELLCLVLYLVPRTSVLGAAALTGYLGGAVATHLRAQEPVVMPVVVGVWVWAGIWLREPRLRALMPLRGR
ncbi:MAG: DoxX family protein [Elusimicrobiota bacterium]|nr:DoxX family protein [Elusimicrobiota bacterium]